MSRFNKLLQGNQLSKGHPPNLKIVVTPEFTAKKVSKA